MFLVPKKPVGTLGSAFPAVAVGIFVAFGGLLYGYDTGTIGGILAMKYWKDEFSTGYRDSRGDLNVTSAQQSLIVSILSAGTFFGALFSAPLADLLGRRRAMIIDCIVFIFGVILQTVAVHIPLFSAGRFFGGLGVGLLSATIPLYQSETAPKWLRGSIVGFYQFSITLGVFLSSIVANSTKNRNDTGSYRIPIAVQFVFALVLIIGMLVLPETPRYLIRKGRYDAAAQSLAKLRRLSLDHPALTEELKDIGDHHEYEMNIGSASYMSCFQKPLRKRLITGILLQAFQQLTGVNFIFYYGTSFFQNTGLSNPFLVTVITDVVNVFSTLPGLLMVEKWGRRPLLLFGAIGMAVCQFIIGSVGTALPENSNANQALIAFICFYIFFFSCSWGPCAWVVTAEIFPLKSRAKALSMTTASNWLLNWALAYSTPYMVNKGDGDANLGTKVFFISASFCCIGAIFTAFCIYETKGLSLEQVDELYENVEKAWKSKGFASKPGFTDAEGLELDKLGEGSLFEPEQDADKGYIKGVLLINNLENTSEN